MDNKISFQLFDLQRCHCLKRWHFLFLAYLLFVLSADAQVAYSRDFQFKEGLYLNFQQFRNNDPVAKSQIISELDKTDLSFFDRIAAKKNTPINYIDSSGIKQTKSISDLWGYSKNNAIFINYDGSFYRIGVIGSLCHFVANVTSYVQPPTHFTECVTER